MLIRKLRAKSGIRFTATLAAQGKPIASTLPTTDRNAAVRAMVLLRRAVTANACL